MDGAVLVSGCQRRNRSRSGTRVGRSSESSGIRRGSARPQSSFRPVRHRSIQLSLYYAEEITNQRTEHRWRAIYLENEYLKCSVLPDLGGHIYTCICKLSG